MCSMLFFVDGARDGEMIVRELYDPAPVCLFFMWATYDLKQHIHTIRTLSAGLRDTGDFLADINAAAREKASGTDKDNNGKKGKFIKGQIIKIERERKTLIE